MAEDGERRSPTSHRTRKQIKRQVEGYNRRPEQIRKRVQRDKARRLLMKEGLVKKYDGKDVNHKNPIRSGGGNERSNLSVQSRSTNRAWAKKKGSTVASKKATHKPGVFRGGVNTNPGSGVSENKRSPKPKPNPRKKVAPKTSRKPKAKPKRNGY